MARHPADAPARGARLVADWARLRDGQRIWLRSLETDWPGSEALCARLAEALWQRHGALLAQVRLALSLESGLTAYRRALARGSRDPDRLAAFVLGLIEALPQMQDRVLVVRALGARARQVLAARVPGWSQDGSSV